MNKIILLSVTALLIGGCSEKSPMQKLQSNKYYEELNNVFWGKELDAKSDLWREAQAYCRDHEEKPNCGAVSQLNFFTSGSTKMIPYGSSGNTLSVPDYTDEDKV